LRWFPNRTPGLEGCPTARAAGHPRPGTTAIRAARAAPAATIKGRHVNGVEEDISQLDDPELLAKYKAAREQAEEHPGDLNAMTGLLRYRNELVRRSRAEWGQP
jgi:hypothetical protein